MGTADKYRVQLDFTPEAFEELERLKTDVGAATRAETVRYAMRVLRWLIRTMQNGGTVFIAQSDGTKSGVEFPFLPHHETRQTSAPRDAIGRRARDAQDQWADRDRDMTHQKEQFRAAYEAGRQAYRETAGGTPEADEDTKSG
jgi:hypothetical protein